MFLPKVAHLPDRVTGPGFAKDLDQRDRSEIFPSNVTTTFRDGADKLPFQNFRALGDSQKVTKQS